MAKFKPTRREPVEQLLRELGPMTKAEIAQHLNWTTEQVNSTIGSTRWLLPGQVFRIVGYSAVTGFRGKDASIFAAQAGRDVPRPDMDKRARRLVTQARYREKNRASINARFRVKRAKGKGQAVVTNPWMQLAPQEMRAHMSQVAANTSMQEAA